MQVFVDVPQEKRKKLDPKSHKGIFVGYDEFVKGFKVYFEGQNRVEMIRDVVFREELLDSEGETSLASGDKRQVVSLVFPIFT